MKRFSLIKRILTFHGRDKNTEFLSLSWRNRNPWSSESSNCIGESLNYINGFDKKERSMWMNTAHILQIQEIIYSREHTITIKQTKLKGAGSIIKRVLFISNGAIIENGASPDATGTSIIHVFPSCSEAGGAICICEGGTTCCMTICERIRKG